MFELLSHAVIG